MDFINANELTKRINWKINLALKGEPKKLYDAANYLATAGGKRVRPVISLMACQAVKGDVKKALNSAVAVELIHTFTLIHDDIMDDDSIRRGAPSVHKVYGKETAILAGDLIFAKAFELADEKIYEILAKASSEICEGQELDMVYEKRSEISEEDYFKMIGKKTAVLFEASTKVGAKLGGVKEDLIESFSTYGRNLGLAFQVYDDLLDVTGNEELIGKPVGSDILQRKKSLVIVKTTEMLIEEKKERFMEILKKTGNSREELNEAILLINESGSINYCKDYSKKLIEKAKNSLNEVRGSDAKKYLLEIADFIIERKK